MAVPSDWKDPVLIEEYYGEDNIYYSNCKCNCGNEFITRSNRIPKSCGCLRGHNSKIHGYKGTRTYRIWRGMIDRCDNENSKDYDDYGGRDIFIEDYRWYKFISFLEDMGECPDEEFTLGRINNDKGYYKENCEWQTNLEQQRNKRNTIYLTNRDGIIKPMRVWAEEIGKSPLLLDNRKRAGWSDVDILER